MKLLSLLSILITAVRRIRSRKPGDIGGEYWFKWNHNGLQQEYADQNLGITASNTELRSNDFSHLLEADPEPIFRSRRYRSIAVPT